ncbi:MAG: S41 family peptidase [Rikenellaceae bacterium]
MRDVRDFITQNFVIFAMLAATMFTSCTSDTDTDTDVEDSDEITAVEWIDQCLEGYYLYNEEYKSLERDLTLSYSAFLNNTLLSMTTNVLDKKYYETINLIPYYDYMIYSYVTCQAATKSRATTTDREDISYGVVSTELVRYNGELAIAILGVYKDSPASEAGLKRGTVITEIEGESISWNSFYYGIGYDLLYPSDGDQMTITTNTTEAQTISATTIETNPILHHEIIDSKIGYIVYSQFDYYFNSDLKEALEEFATAGVTDLIVDLRLNPGGYVASARLFGSIIGGNYCTDQVFSYYIMNEDLTTNSASTESLIGFTYDSSQRAFYSKFESTDVKLTTLSPRIYCLVSEDTASASELLINSLRGIDFEVILIGSKTEGKNVGMINFNTTIDDYEYDLYPISFENRNAKMEGDYFEGMEVDYEVSDLLDYKGFNDYGVDDPLVTKAMELITGIETSASTTRAESTLSLTKLGNAKNHHKVGGAVISPKN